ncbi:hypothetical protein EIN_252590 [Entamoeba invadens IP1]|uniref:Uncharacterized protein n=1 Tax=Entamoeba invadens IP1 TaxID=370355 RepID=A0A0A1UEP2_ENTIV|nr:hypothetical protein EIN_252590 [Entamoeba invadens IP1]ELP95025.1 hypothetical protein EIN_252590 [Entamoeba invadens IP1]|eukprot:XP_004261796.1 hypothetical protein EIN_252590 [Entamoeba invadens IP1]
MLEKVFLANVILYVDCLDTVKLFSQVSKKCQEVLLILKVNPIFPRKNTPSTTSLCNVFSNDKIDLVKRIKSELKLFPNLQTYQFSSGMFSMGLLRILPKHIKNIVIGLSTINSPDIFSEEDKAKIVSMSVVSSEPFDLSQFPNLRRVSLVIDEDDYISCFTDKTHHFDFVKVKLSEPNSLPFLIQADKMPIDRMVVVFDCDVELGKAIKNIPHISQKFYLTMEYMYETMPLHVTPLYTDGMFEVDQVEAFDTGVLKRVLPTKVYFIGKNGGEIDLRAFTDLKSVKYEEKSKFCLPSGITQLQVDEPPTQVLPNLLEMSVEKYDGNLSVPSTLRRLELRECNIQMTDKNLSVKMCGMSRTSFDQVTMLEGLQELMMDNMDISVSLDCLKDLTSVDMSVVKINCDIEKYYPSNLKNLVCGPGQLKSGLSIEELFMCSANESDLVKLASLHNLKTFQACRVHFDFLKMELPTSLRRFLVTTTDGNGCSVDLRKYEQLQWISFASSSQLKVLLPTKLPKLSVEYCEGVVIENIQDIELKELTLNNQKGINLDNIRNTLSWLYLDKSDLESESEESGENPEIAEKLKKFTELMGFC